MYHARFWLLERNSVHCLPTKPFPVLDLNGTEELNRHVHFGHIFQPQKRLLKVICAELLMQTVGSRKVELADPIRVIVDNEVHELLR